MEHRKWQLKHRKSVLHVPPFLHTTWVIITFPVRVFFFRKPFSKFTSVPTPVHPLLLVAPGRCCCLQRFRLFFLDLFVCLIWLPFHRNSCYFTLNEMYFLIFRSAVTSVEAPLHPLSGNHRRTSNAHFFKFLNCFFNFFFFLKLYMTVKCLKLVLVDQHSSKFLRSILRHCLLRSTSNN